MNIEDFRDYCLAKPGVTEEAPFGPETLVFKVGGKIFALTDIDTFGSINLKCDPERAVDLREAHDYVLPGFHMNKKIGIRCSSAPAPPRRNCASSLTTLMIWCWPRCPKPYVKPCR